MDTNIQVGIRVRPLIDREIQAQQKPLWRTNKNRIFNQDRDYQFDRVFDQDTCTEDIYNVLGKPLVEKAMEGFNGTLFAYGQTASGKTHTIMGDTTEPGIVPMAMADVFNHINEQPDREFLLRASYLEIYNEEITDLITNQKGIKIRNNVDNEIVIENLAEVSLTSFEDAMDMIQKGIRNRKIGTTNMNERSSRSHVIFRLVIESRLLSNELDESEIDGAIIVSQMNIVDLAGSERAAQTGAHGVRLKESGFINASLMTLGVVIRKLSEKLDGHVPYRDSKLTRILQNSLGGNARTSIICTVSPVVLDETDQTLKFAGRAKNVTNKPKINEVVDDKSKMKQQMKEIRNLKKKIEQLEGNDLHMERLQDKDMMQLQQQTIEEQQGRISKLLKQIVCSSKRKMKTQSKARRMTWCPGGLTALRSLKEDELERKAVSLNVNSARKRSSLDSSDKRCRSIPEEESFEKICGDLDSTESFEKIEYAILKREFEQYKASTCSPEEYDALTKRTTHSNMEIDALRKKIRELKDECNNLQAVNLPEDALVWKQSMEITLEQKLNENAQLLTQMYDINQQKESLEGKIAHLTEENRQQTEEAEGLKCKCEEMVQLQEKMISMEDFEQLKQEVQVKSNELQLAYEKLEKEAEEKEVLKKTLEEKRYMEEEYQSSNDRSAQCEIENNSLKQRIKELQEECESLRSHEQDGMKQSIDNEQLQAIEDTLCKRNDEIYELKQNKSELESLAKSLEEDIGTLNENLQEKTKEGEILQQKCDDFAQRQDNMISMEFLEKLKEEVTQKSMELEEGNRKKTVEIEELNQLLTEQKERSSECISLVEKERDILIDQMNTVETNNTEMERLQSELEETKCKLEEWKLKIDSSEESKKLVEELKSEIQRLSNKEQSESEQSTKVIDTLLNVKNVMSNYFGTDDIHCLNDLLHELVTSKDETAHKMVSLREKLSLVENEQSNILVANEQLRCDCIEKDKTVTRLEQQCVDLQNGSELKPKHIEEQNFHDSVETEEKMTNLRNELNIVKLENEELLIQLDEVKNQFMEASKKPNELTEVNEQFFTQITELELQISQLKDELDSERKQQFSDNKDDSEIKENLELKVSELQINIDNLTAELEQRCQDISQLSETKSNVELELTKLNLSSNEEIMKHEQVLQQKNHEIEALKVEISELKDCIETKSHTENEPVNEDIDHNTIDSTPNLKMENQKLIEKIEKLNATIKEKEEEKVKLTANCYDQDLSKISTVNETMQEKMNESDQQIDSFIVKHEDEVTDIESVNDNETNCDQSKMNITTDDSNHLRHDIQQKIMENQSLHIQIEELQQQLGTKAATIEILTSDIQLKADELESAKIDLQILSTQFDSKQEGSNETSTLNEENFVHYKSLYEDTLKEEERLKEQIKEQEERITVFENATEKQVEDLESIIIEKSSLETIIDNMAEEKVNLVDSINKLNSDVSDLQKQIEDTTSNNAVMDSEDEKARLLERISVLSNENDILKGQLQDVEEIKNAKTILDDQVNRLKNDTTRFESDIETLKDVIESQNEETEILQTRLEKKCHEYIELSKKEQLLQSKIENLNLLKETAEEKTRVLEQQLDELQQIQQNAVQQTESYMHQIQKLQAENEMIQDHNVELQSKHSNTELEVNNVSANDVNQTEDNDQIAGYDHLIERLQEQLNEKQTTIIDLNKELLEVKEENNENLVRIKEKNQLIIKYEAECENFHEERTKYEKIEEMLAEVQQEKSDVELQLTVLHEEKQQLDHELDSLQKCEEAFLDQIEQLKNDHSKELEKYLDNEKLLEERLSVASGTLKVAQQETDLQMNNYKGAVEEIKNLRATSNASKTEIRELHIQIENVTAEKLQMEQNLEQQKIELDNEKDLAKAAYERRSAQAEAYSEELILSLKKVQSELSRSNNIVDAYTTKIQELQTEIRVLEQKIQDTEESKVQGIENQNIEFEMLKEKYTQVQEEVENITTVKNKTEINFKAKEEEYELLSKNYTELQFLFQEKQAILQEKESLLKNQIKNSSESSSNALINEVDTLREKLANSKEQYEQLQADLAKLHDENNAAIKSKPDDCDESGSDLKEKIRRLEYRLKLRQEDLGVYNDRVKEQDEEIRKLKTKKDQYSDQVKKMSKMMTNMRRPSGNADTQEWEAMILKLETAKLDVEKENEQLEVKYSKLMKKHAVVSESLRNATIRMQQAEKALKNGDHDMLEKLKEKESEITDLKAEVKKLQTEVERITKGLKSAFTKMTGYQSQLKESQGKFESQTKIRNEELEKVTRGLSIAFERYKHYKGEFNKKDEELKSVQETLCDERKNSALLHKKLADVETSVITSMKRQPLQPSKEIQTQSTSTEQYQADVNTSLKTRLISETQDTVPSSSNVESQIEKIDVGERKRKSESPHQQSPSRRFKSQLQSTPNSPTENECNQQ